MMTRAPRHHQKTNRARMSEDSSKEWMFHGTMEILHTMDWDRSDVAEDRRMLAESLKEAFTDFGPTIQRIFSDHAPTSIDYAVIVSNIYEATDDQRGNERMMGVPIRGYLATATRVHRKAWEESNTLCDVRGTPLTWTKITGGIRSWPQFNHDRADVNDPENGRCARRAGDSELFRSQRKNVDVQRKA
jgi:hypothetical protein